MSSMIRPGAVVAGIAAMALMTTASPAGAQERYAVGGGDVAVYNLAGEVTVVGTSGGEVTVEVRRGGSDASHLDVQVGEIDGRQTLRVIYPSDRVSYSRDGGNSSSSLRVRPDGTWGGDRDGWRDRGDRVRVSSRGGGLDAHADLRIGVPRGQRIAVYLAVGEIEAENVNGRVLLDTHAGGVSARSMAGYLNIDTGSGGVVVDGMDGDLNVDTGSGGVRVSNVSGEDIGIDTGSGAVHADGLRGRRIEIDTGSGGIELRSSTGRDIRLDTGSGAVEAHLLSDIDDLVVDTGSGSVILSLPGDLGATLDIETGSGGIEVDFPVMVTRRARDELRGTVGDGRGSIKIDTGSGGVRIRSQ